MTVPNLTRLLGERSEQTIRIGGIKQSGSDALASFVVLSLLGFLNSLFLMLALGIAHAHIWHGVPLLSYWETYLVGSGLAVLARPFTLRRHTFGSDS